jgi:hypothetical protein
MSERWYMRMDDDELDLLIEAAELLRLYSQGFTNVDGRAKVTCIKRLEARLAKRRDKRRLTTTTKEHEG